MTTPFTVAASRKPDTRNVDANVGFNASSDAFAIPLGIVVSTWATSSRCLPLDTLAVLLGVVVPAWATFSRCLPLDTFAVLFGVIISTRATGSRYLLLDALTILLGVGVTTWAGCLRWLGPDTMSIPDILTGPADNRCASWWSNVYRWFWCMACWQLFNIDRDTMPVIVGVNIDRAM